MRQCANVPILGVTRVVVEMKCAVCAIVGNVKNKWCCIKMHVKQPQPNRPSP